MEIRYANNSSQLGIKSCVHCIVGTASDDRGRASINFGKGIADSTNVLIYSAETLSYSFMGQTFDADDLDPLAACFRAGNVLCDTTTLGFVETFLCIRAFKEANAGEAWLIYVEPEGYQSERTAGVLHKRDFSLSDKAQTFTAVPGAVVLLNNQRRSKAAILVGYEGDRLQQFLEQNNVGGDECTVVYGVPAFYAGWETNAFANTVGELDERRISSVLFAGATNPMAAYEAIQAVHRGSSGDNDLVIVPIGTKPHGIGAALYACDNERVGLVYDHPQKRAGRTGGVGIWNYYRLKH